MNLQTRLFDKRFSQNKQLWNLPSQLCLAQVKNRQLTPDSLCVGGSQFILTLVFGPGLGAGDV